jgi:DNA-binding transcriptional regulator YiaG
MAVNQMMQHDFVGGPVAQDYSEILGTPFKVFLSSGVTTELDRSTGKTITEITDLAGLIAAVVRSRALHPRKLSGDDLKYIRSALGLRSHEVASVLDLTPEHYSRCESGTKTLSSSVEKHYRMFVFLEASCRDKDLRNKMSQNKQANKVTDPEKAKKAVSAFRRVFVEMKIQHIYPIGEDLEFSFSRRECPPECNDCGEEDGEWQNEADRDAA